MFYTLKIQYLCAGFDCFMRAYCYGLNRWHYHYLIRYHIQPKQVFIAVLMILTFFCIFIKMYVRDKIASGVSMVVTIDEVISKISRPKDKKSNSASHSQMNQKSQLMFFFIQEITNKVK